MWNIAADVQSNGTASSRSGLVATRGATLTICAIDTCADPPALRLHRAGHVFLVRTVERRPEEKYCFVFRRHFTTMHISFALQKPGGYYYPTMILNTNTHLRPVIRESRAFHSSSSSLDPPILPPSLPSCLTSTILHG